MGGGGQAAGKGGRYLQKKNLFIMVNYGPFLPSVVISCFEVTPGLCSLPLKLGKMAGPLKEVHATTGQQCMYFELFSVAVMVYADSPMLFHPAFHLMQCTVRQQAWYQAFICVLTTVTNLLL